MNNFSPYNNNTYFGNKSVLLKELKNIINQKNNIDDLIKNIVTVNGQQYNFSYTLENEKVNEIRPGYNPKKFILYVKSLNNNINRPLISFIVEDQSNLFTQLKNNILSQTGGRKKRNSIKKRKSSMKSKCRK